MTNIRIHDITSPLSNGVNGTSTTCVPNINSDRSLHEKLMEDKLWGEIRRAALKNKALHEALERAKIIYYLSKG